MIQEELLPVTSAEQLLPSFSPHELREKVGSMEIQAAAPLYVFYMKSSLFPQDGPGNGCPLDSFWFLLSRLALR